MSLPATPHTSISPRRRGWTLGIVSVGLFMVVLDNLVVNVALPSIHRDLGASIQALEWTVSAYVLAYAVLLLTGSALGDRFGRKRMFIAGIALFTPPQPPPRSRRHGLLIAARASQGVGAAIVTPLTLTLLADAFPPERRGVALGVWSGISGVAVALGPLVGGAVIQAARGTGSSGSTSRSASRSPRSLPCASPRATARRDDWTSPASPSPPAVCSGSCSASCEPNPRAGAAPTS